MTDNAPKTDYRALAVLAEEIGIITHKLNNLVFPVMGLSDVALMQAQEGPTREYLTHIKQFSEILADTIRQMSANDRLSPHDLTTKSAAVIRECFSENCAHLSRNIDVKVLDELELETCVRCEPELLATAIRRIIDNAVDAMPNGGELSLALAKVNLTSKKAAEIGLPGGSYVRAVIANSGPPPDDEALRRGLFPFFCTKPGDDHAGLGLWVAYCKLHNMGGTVALQRSNSGGAQTVVYLPVDIV